MACLAAGLWRTGVTVTVGRWSRLILAISFFRRSTDFSGVVEDVCEILEYSSCSHFNTLIEAFLTWSSVYRVCKVASIVHVPTLKNSKVSHRIADPKRLQDSLVLRPDSSIQAETFSANT